MNVVVAMARMVPMGMDFWASRRSPDRLEPAMMPEDRSDNIQNISVFQASLRQLKHTRLSYMYVKPLSVGLELASSVLRDFSLGPMFLMGRGQCHPVTQQICLCTGNQVQHGAALIRKKEDTLYNIGTLINHK